MIPSARSQGVRRPTALCAKASSDRVPPSPLLSARRIRMTYLKVTITMIVQSSREVIPITSRPVSPSSAAARRPSRMA